MEEKYRFELKAYDKDADVWETIAYDPDFSIAVQKARVLAVAMRKGFLTRPVIDITKELSHEPFDRIEIWDAELDYRCVFMDY